MARTKTKQWHDLTGKRFGRLVAQWPAGTYKQRIVWLFLCDCGKTCIVRRMGRGFAHSCGCLKGEANVRRCTTHGLTRGHAWKNGTVPLHYRLFLKAKGRAKELNVPFEITLADVCIPERCPLLDVPLKPGSPKNHENSPSLDRIDPSLGYVRGNVWIVSHRANQIKSNATLEELKKITVALERKIHGFCNEIRTDVHESSGGAAQRSNGSDGPEARTETTH